MLDAFLNFDQTKLKVLEVSAGDLENELITNNFNNTAGTIDFSARLPFDYGPPFPTDEITVASIQFEALAATDPTTAVTFSTAEDRTTQVLGTAPAYVTGTLTGGTYTVSELVMPVVTTGAATELTINSAKLNLTVNDYGSATSLTVSFNYWGGDINIDNPFQYLTGNS